MSILRSVIFLAITTLLFACKPKSNESQTSTAQKTISAPVKVFQSASGIPQEEVENIVNNCSHIDVIFNDMPISMSMNDRDAILNDLSYVSPEPISEIPNNCAKPIGRKVFNGNGEIMLEADIYFSQECVFFAFIKDEKLLFGNKMNQKGINFYNNIIKQVTGQE